MTLSKGELVKISHYIYKLHNQEPLDGDEIEQINQWLKEANGDTEQ